MHRRAGVRVAYWVASRRAHWAANGDKIGLSVANSKEPFRAGLETPGIPHHCADRAPY